MPKQLRTAGACLLAVVLVLVGVAQTSVGTSVARSIGLAAPSEPYTELYFTATKAIAAATEGTTRLDSHQTVTFVIANHQSRRMTYRWQLRSAGVLRDSGTLVLNAGQKQSVSTPTPILTGCRFQTTQPAGARDVHSTKRTKHSKQSKQARRAAAPRRARVSAAPRSIGPTRTQITVTLSQPHDAINYWVACRA